MATKSGPSRIRTDNFAVNESKMWRKNVEKKQINEVDKKNIIITHID